MVTRCQQLPVAVFGKRRPFEPGIVQEYSLLDVSDDFPPDLIHSFEATVRRFRWRSQNEGVAHRFAPCTGIWQVDNHRWLVIRFTDEGQDDRQRPHLLHARGVVFDASKADNPQLELLGIATTPQWPEPQKTSDGCVSAAEISWQLPDQDQLRRWRETASCADPGLVTFYSSDDKFQYDCAPGEKAYWLGNKNAELLATAGRESHQSGRQPATSPRGKLGIFGWLILGTLTLTLLTGVARVSFSQGKAIRSAEDSKLLHDRTDERDDLKAKLAALSVKLATAEENLKREKQRNAQLFDELQRSEDENRRLNEGLSPQDRRELDQYSQYENLLHDLQGMKEKLEEIVATLKPTNNP